MSAVLLSGGEAGVSWLTNAERVLRSVDAAPLSRYQAAAPAGPAAVAALGISGIEKACRSLNYFKSKARAPVVQAARRSLWSDGAARGSRGRPCVPGLIALDVYDACWRSSVCG